jgi:glycosyltransferase involved in cell wall biosynthesis
MFKIISVGWQCAQFMEQTLQSVEDQIRDDWEMMVVYDRSTDNGAELLADWSNGHLPPGKREYLINPDQQYAPHNQYTALQYLNPADDDIVIWLDLDGDMLAHPGVLDRVAQAYADGTTLLTYGTYRAVPDPGTPPPISLVPPDVVARNSYRIDALYNGPRFNHLRTMKGCVAKSIPLASFQWRQQPGNWYRSGADYLWMISGLERAGGKYQLIPDILVIYNDANPLQDNKNNGQETTQCDIDFLNGVPLAPLL